jgi:ABC-2 type transport system permease protein
MIMVVAVWNGGATDDLAERIKTGDVAVDLYRPASLLLWYLATDLGRATYHLVTRGLAPMVVGALLFPLRFPATPVQWGLFTVSVLLAVVVSFGIRMLVSASAFWLLDDAGPKQMNAVLAMFLSGLTVPLVLFPGWTRAVAMLLPWAAYLQAPADIFLGKSTGTGLWGTLGLQAAWAVVVLLLAAGVLRLADRKVVVQGG